MSVVAPGVQIPTTDIRGADGRNDNGGDVKAGCVSYGSAGDEDGDYYFYFNGTSAAAPHLSGVAALVVSTNAFLDNKGARYVIEATADKVGSREYVDPTERYPSGSWNQHMGHGRINARKGVELAGALFVQQANQIFE
jgi:subtilisin family serine protease